MRVMCILFCSFGNLFSGPGKVLVLVLVLKEKVLVLVLTKKSWSWSWSWNPESWSWSWQKSLIYITAYDAQDCCWNSVMAVSPWWSRWTLHVCHFVVGLQRRSDAVAGTGITISQRWIKLTGGTRSWWKYAGEKCCSSCGRLSRATWPWNDDEVHDATLYCGSVFPILCLYTRTLGLYRIGRWLCLAECGYLCQLFGEIQMHGSALRHFCNAVVWIAELVYVEKKLEVSWN